MNVSRTTALTKIYNYYKFGNQLIDMAGGQIKTGMLNMLVTMCGELKNFKLEDLNKVKELTEKEFVDWAFQKFYPGLYNYQVNRNKPKEEPKEEPKEQSETNNCVQISKEDLNLIHESIKHIGSILVKMSLKMDEEIELQKKVLKYWEG